MTQFVPRSKVEKLFDGHGSDVFNVCLRVAGSRHAAAAATKAAFLEAFGDHEPPIGLMAAARRQSAALVESGPSHDATAKSPLEVRDESARLEIRYREVLALRELVGCSYEEIGRIVDADREAVAELLWRARLELRDALEGSTLVSIAPVASSCGRALALIVMHWDGELHDADERHWLQRHLRTCGKCRLSQEAVRQASASYREWPRAATPLGLRESLLDAAESGVASDSPERLAAGSETSSRRPPGSPLPGAPRGARRSPR